LNFESVVFIQCEVKILILVYLICQICLKCPKSLRGSVSPDEAISLNFRKISPQLVQCTRKHDVINLCYSKNQADPIRAQQGCRDPGHIVMNTRYGACSE